VGRRLIRNLDGEFELETEIVVKADGKAGCIPDLCGFLR
jgi:hypothetical protein